MAALNALNDALRIVFRPVSIEKIRQLDQVFLKAGAATHGNLPSLSITNPTVEFASFGSRRTTSR